MAAVFLAGCGGTTTTVPSATQTSGTSAATSTGATAASSTTASTATTGGASSGATGATAGGATDATNGGATSATTGAATSATTGGATSATTGGATSGGNTGTTGATTGSEAACSGIVPTSFTPVTVGFGSLDLTPTSDRAGNAVIGHMVGSGPEAPKFDILSFSSGQLQDLNSFGGSDDTAFFVFGQPSGFVVGREGMQGGYALQTYDHNGTQTSTNQLRASMDHSPLWISPSPLGGAFALHLAAGSNARPLTLSSFDGSGHALGSAQVTASATEMMAIGVDSSGHALAVWRVDGSSTLHARWYDAAATPLSSELELAPGVTGVQITWFEPLADGSLALVGSTSSATTAGLARFADGAGPTALPAWFGGYASARLTVIRGGAGYAVLPGVTCAGVELLASSGASCGCVLASPGRRLAVGMDGSVFVSGSSATDWYPALLK